MGATQAGSQPVSYARATGQIILGPCIIGAVGREGKMWRREGGGDVGDHAGRLTTNGQCCMHVQLDKMYNLRPVLNWGNVCSRT